MSNSSINAHFYQFEATSADVIKMHTLQKYLQTAHVASVTAGNFDMLPAE